MLSEEEKKAIERLEEQLNFWKKQNIKNSDCEIILSFITKLQKENEKYKYLYQKALDNTVSSDKENIQLKKQIDLMGEVIFEKFKAQLVIEYGIENKEQFVKLFKEKAKEEGKQ